MTLRVNINYRANIDELLSKYKYLKFLKNFRISKEDKNKWYVTCSEWNLDNDPIYELQVMFIGKTGYGKSTTLNKIVGKKVFESDDVQVCTKDLYSATYRIDKENFLSLSDLPGIGESNYADNQYYEWYRDMLKKSHCVVYLLRADQRDFAVDEILFKSMFTSDEDRKKVIFALNFAEKIEPISRENQLSSQQILNLNKKVKEVAQIFNVSREDILYYSAKDNINLDVLMKKISDKLKLFV